MNVLGLFDGKSCGQIALERAGLSVDRYYASEIDKYAIKVAQINFPDTIQLGNIENWRDWTIDWSSIDLLIGGSPCQGFSFAGDGLAFDDPRSKLFFTYVDILKHIMKFNPDVKFMLENVKMKKKHSAIITLYLNTYPVQINSALVSAQNRIRNYWANWDFGQPEDKGIMLIDILEPDLPDTPIGIEVRKKSKCVRISGRFSPFGDRRAWCTPFQRITKKGKLKPTIDKSGCLTGGAHSGGNHSDMDLIHTEYTTRRYSPTECERLQTVPDGYTDHVSNSQRYKMLGNGWTIDVITHILKGLNS